MTHPLVTQLRFARSELMRCLEGVSDQDARRRFEPMNCISWIVGHPDLPQFVGDISKSPYRPES